MKRIINISLILLVVTAFVAQAQTRESILQEGQFKSLFEDKFKVGLSHQIYWGSIVGENLEDEYFYKPCLGFNVRVEYYPLSFVGLAIGGGLQMRGAGIINPDNSGGAFTHPWDKPQYDPDSTHRERLRVNAIEIPVTLILRTPVDIIKGMRLSAAVGVCYVSTIRVTNVFLVPEDGYHIMDNRSDEYLKSDLAFQLSIGPEIDAFRSCLLQTHFVYTRGTSNVYRSFDGEGKLQTMGVRVAFLY